MTDEYPVVLKQLPSRIHGFCCLGSDYEPIIVINENLPLAERRKTYLHEVSHIESGEMFDPLYNEYGDAI